MPAFAAAWLKRLWPQTLFAQLLLIMVCGVLAIQLLSSSIWFDVRFAQALEAPVRLAASRTATLVAQGCDAVETQTMPTGYQLNCMDQQPHVEAADKRGLRRIEPLLRQAMAHELGHEPTVHLLEARLTDTQGQPLVWRSLFGLDTAQAHLRFAVAQPDGRWLQVGGHEQQGWSGESAWALIADYVLRVYVLRILAVLGICWLAVRLCLRPLQRLGEAARGLGDNLERPPLPLNGPLEVREAAQAFNVMQQRLIAMLREQAHFLAAVSHDLRTPLTRMRLRIERLTDDEQRERLKNSINQMDAMIAQVLDFQRATEPGVAEPVDVMQLVTALCDELASSDEPLPVSGSAAPIPGNPLLLQRCLQNLLENALRYARAVEVVVIEKEQGVAIRIQDRGPGIEPALLERITEPFVRGETSRNVRSGGYGLGLSIASRIALAHGGTLSLENRAGVGLAVELWLPASHG
ncbi:signal transduction histidine kinase [Pseudomonas sp. AG1028]|nr:signal transduction histidine kinase [Pseudomonas sp. AG1028]